MSKKKKGRLCIPPPTALTTSSASSSLFLLALTVHIATGSRTPPTHGARPDSDDVFFAFGVGDVEQDGHAERAEVIAVGMTGGVRDGSGIGGVERRLNGQHVGDFIFLVETALVNLFGGVDVELVLALHVDDVFFDFAEVGRQRGPLLRRDDRPCVQAAGLEAAGDDHGAGGVPLDDAEFLAGPLEDLDEGAVAALPDVDVGVHEGGGCDEFAGGGEGHVVPAEAVDYVLELVLDLEFDGGGFEVDAEAGEVGHDDRADDAVGAVGEEVASVAGESEEDDDAVAETHGVDGGAGLCFDDVKPAFGCSGDDVVAQRCEDRYAGRVFCVLGGLFRDDGGVDFFVWWGRGAEWRRGEDAFDRFGG